MADGLESDHSGLEETPSLSIQEAIRALHLAGIRVYPDIKRHRISLRRDLAIPLPEAATKVLTDQGEAAYVWLLGQYRPQEYAQYRALMGRDVQQVATDLLALIRARGLPEPVWDTPIGGRPALRVRMAILACRQVDEDPDGTLDALGFLGSDAVEPAVQFREIQEQRVPDNQELIGRLLDEAEMEEGAAFRLVRDFEPLRIERQLDWLPYRNARNPAATLAAAVRNDYEAPTGAEEDLAGHEDTEKYYVGRYAVCPRCRSRPCLAGCDRAEAGL